jgi:hypothetical protein
VTGGEVTTETGKSYFVFYPPIFVYNLLISDSWSSPSAITLFRRGPVGPWAYSTIHGLGRLFVKARPGPGPSTTAQESLMETVLPVHITETPMPIKAER